MIKREPSKAEGAPNATASHVKVIARAAFVHPPEGEDVKSSQRPFPFLEPARTVSPIAPTNERMRSVENAIMLGVRLGTALRRAYFHTELRLG